MVYFSENEGCCFYFCTLELFLNPDEVEKLHDFEEECVEDYTRVTRKAELHKAEGQVEILNKK